jgi:MFS family permease
VKLTGNLRTMALATLANTIGSGLWIASVAIYLTRYVGLTATQVGLGFSIAGLAGLVASMPLGHLADRRDPRSLRALIQLLQVLVALSYLLVGSFGWFVVVAVLESLLQVSNLTVRAALVSAVGGESGRVEAFAVLQSVGSIGIGAGAAVAALGLTIDSRAGYQAMVVANAATFLISAALLMRLPAFPPNPGQSPSRPWDALRDFRFLAVSGVSAVLALHRPVLSLIVPLWIAQHTSAPRAAISAVLVVSTAMSVLFSVRVSRGVRTATTAAKALRRSGFALGAGMLLYAAAAGPPAPVAVALLVGATVIFAVGELHQSTAEASLAYELARPGALGQYLGANRLVTGLAFALGPVLLSTLVLDRPNATGWAGLTVIFVAAGLVAPLLVAAAISRESSVPHQY